MNDIINLEDIYYKDPTTNYDTESYHSNNYLRKHKYNYYFQQFGKKMNHRVRPAPVTQSTTPVRIPDSTPVPPINYTQADAAVLANISTQVSMSNRKKNSLRNVKKMEKDKNDEKEKMKTYFAENISVDGLVDIVKNVNIKPFFSENDTEYNEFINKIDNYKNTIDDFYTLLFDLYFEIYYAHNVLNQQYLILKTSIHYWLQNFNYELDTRLRIKGGTKKKKKNCRKITHQKKKCGYRISKKRTIKKIK